MRWSNGISFCFYFEPFYILWKITIPSPCNPEEYHFSYIYFDNFIFICAGLMIIIIDWMCICDAFNCFFNPESKKNLNKWHEIARNMKLWVRGTWNIYNLFGYWGTWRATLACKSFFFYLFLSLSFSILISVHAARLWSVWPLVFTIWLENCQRHRFILSHKWKEKMMR